MGWSSCPSSCLRILENLAKNVTSWRKALRLEQSDLLGWFPRVCAELKTLDGKRIARGGFALMNEFWLMKTMIVNAAQRVHHLSLSTQHFLSSPHIVTHLQFAHERQWQQKSYSKTFNAMKRTLESLFSVSRLKNKCQRWYTMRLSNFEYRLVCLFCGTDPLFCLVLYVGWSPVPFRGRLARFHYQLWQKTRMAPLTSSKSTHKQTIDRD